MARMVTQSYPSEVKSPLQRALKTPWVLLGVPGARAARQGYAVARSIVKELAAVPGIPLVL
jgi:hypothetical protein